MLYSGMHIWLSWFYILHTRTQQYTECPNKYGNWGTKSHYLYRNLACLFVCLYPINVKTAEPIGPKFFVGHHVTAGKVYEWTKFKIFVSIKIRSSLNFWKFWNPRNFLWKSANYFCFVLRFTQREHVHN